MNHEFRFAYFLIMLAALTTCSLLLRRWQQKLPLEWWQKLGIGVGAFCGAMIGAKLPFLFLDWNRFLDGSAWLFDGKTIMCGIIGGYVGVELAKWTLDIRVKTGDTFAVPCAVAVAIGRIACFVGGCCFGTPTNLPWGVVFQNARDSLPRHPTQIYEAAFHLAVADLLLLLQSRGIFRGQLIKLYILIYLAYRFATEFIRPETKLELGLTAYQWAALAMMPLFAFLWWRDARQPPTDSSSIRHNDNEHVNSSPTT